MTLLWHGARPVGICVFASPARVLAQRHRVFGIRSASRAVTMKALERQLWTLSRVVLHPSYRGAGLAAEFMRNSCRLVPRPWIEAQTQLGWFHPLFERAGFIRIGHSKARKKSRAGHSIVYGGGTRRHGRQKLITEETYQQGRFAEPVYYLYDNRQHTGITHGAEQES